MKLYHYDNDFVAISQLCERKIYRDALGEIYAYREKQITTKQTKTLFNELNRELNNYIFLWRLSGSHLTFTEYYRLLNSQFIIKKDKGIFYFKSINYFICV